MRLGIVSYFSSYSIVLGLCYITFVGFVGVIAFLCRAATGPFFFEKATKFGDARTIVLEVFMFFFRVWHRVPRLLRNGLDLVLGPVKLLYLASAKCLKPRSWWKGVSLLRC